MLEFIFLLVGILVGMNIRAEWMQHKYNKTLEQVDQEMRNQLQFYKNLSESLKQDLHWAKAEKDNDGKKKEK
jgi:cytochrome b subunit of formate dehydrogenase